MQISLALSPTNPLITGGGGVFIDDLGRSLALFIDDLGRPLTWFFDDIGRRL